jgi:hypothetical protein
MKQQLALTAFAFLVATGCNTTGVTNPSRGDALASVAAQPASVESVARSGELHATKECSKYFGQAGEFCTITSSNLKEIPVGTRVYYASAAVPPNLDTEVTLDPPGPGNNTASGHVVLSFVTASGTVVVSGGTGKFKRFHANAVVSHLDGVNWAWNGTYSYGD